MIIPVILCGGTGTRLWPLSRELHPKQFLPLVDGQSSILQATVMRLRGLEDLGPPVAICNEEHRFLVSEQLREIGVDPAAILLEPCGRDTAPAVALAALEASDRWEDAVLLVLPADHVIQNAGVLLDAIRAALPLAEEGRLVLFGVRPERPETAYGYVEKGEALPGGVGHAVRGFVEKPDRDTARRFVSGGHFLWNSGIVLMRARAALQELERYTQPILDAVREARTGARADLAFTRLPALEFARCPAGSFDREVLENTTRAVVVTLDAGWTDVGSWNAMWEVQPGDEQGNVSHGDVVLQDVRDSFVRSGSRLVTVAGVEGLVVVETADAVFVASRDRAHEVGDIVASLKAHQRPEALHHKRVLRPWGGYESLVVGDRFRVKRIHVNPGQALSLQKHQHRAEHWVVVRGNAKVTCGDRELTLSEDESTYIPVGEVHRLENPGTVPLEIVEVQTGAYLGEDDIVRIEDRYGRGPGSVER